MENEGPGEFDPAILGRMDQEARLYVTAREVEWESALDAEHNTRADTMEVCTAYNQQVRALRRE